MKLCFKRLKEAKTRDFLANDLLNSVIRDIYQIRMAKDKNWLNRYFEEVNRITQDKQILKKSIVDMYEF